MCKQTPHRRWSKLGALLSISLCTTMIAGCSFPGTRLLSMEVYQNDQLILRTTFDAPDSEGPADFWRRAGVEPFASDENVARVKHDEGNLLRATISGAMRIRILHGETVMTRASLNDLTLVRKTHESSRWYLSEEEVQRAKQAAGL